jgi:hypothetical protein
MKPRDLLLLIEHLPEREEIPLPDAQGELADGVPEEAGELGLDELGRVDPEPVDVELCDQVLVGADQGLAHREHRADRARLPERGHQLLEGREVPGLLAALALSAEQRVAPELDRPDRRVTRHRIGGGGEARERRTAARVAPADGVGGLPERRRRAEPVVRSRRAACGSEAKRGSIARKSWKP